ncbi:cupin domain-containing protein [Pseudoalteromonas sp. MMG022]|uniref:cupin domain-containing protein n=1 Tax=Pseudoalteromonas sp. MMG022 TaxID=2909978 RepID=UPI001F1FF421|nr:cupin domain-containing protein [Pseudoalteromonas sp. MMG022]MCF6435675.1 cupin domain-containing protein [Pseudoalteromonas sp. MMG022]
MLENLLANLPLDTSKEHFEDLLSAKDVRIERIVSYGQTSPDSFWYDQDEHEWVLVLSGCGTVEFKNGEKHSLECGDFLNIPAYTQHRVSHTATSEATVWLAIFYRD